MKAKQQNEMLLQVQDLAPMHVQIVTSLCKQSSSLDTGHPHNPSNDESPQLNIHFIKVSCPGSHLFAGTPPMKLAANLPCW